MNTDKGAVAELEVNDGVDRDWLLQLLVTHINTGGGSLPVTLWTGAGIIAGQLISGKEYFELFIEHLTSGDEPEDAAVTAKTLREVGSVYYSDAEPRAADTVYLHLKQAQLFSTGGTIPAEEGAIWRGRISQVIGFNYGALARAQSTD